MPLQDASKPSRKAILAAERKAHGAYDPVRLSKLLPPRLKLEKQPSRRLKLISSFTDYAHLLKREDTQPGAATDPMGGSDSTTAAPSDSQTNATPLPPAPANSGAVPASPPPPPEEDPAPVAVAQTDNGDVHSDLSGLVAADTPMRNDTSPSQNYTLTSADTSSGSSSDQSDDGLSQSTIGLVAGGLVTLVLFVIALGVWFRCYRFRRGGKAWRKRSRSHRLGSMDGLRNVSTDGKGRQKGEGEEDKTGSSDFLVSHLVAPGTAGPFDRAVANMVSNRERQSSLSIADVDRGIKTVPSFLELPLSGPGLAHQRSLDSIAEVAEPPSSVCANFNAAKRDSSLSFLDTTPQKVSWSDRLTRPTTSPGETARPFGTSPASTLSSTPSSKKGRPQSARSGGEIEMTRRGSQLVIRPKSSASTLRRPLSSAGGGLRGAWRRTREGDAICIDTDGIGDQSENDGVYELSSPKLNTSESRPLRSHFSSSSSILQAPRDRASCGTITTNLSPAGSFSFEIRDAIPLSAPLMLEGSLPAASPAAEGQGEASGIPPQSDKIDSTESFVRDMDWDLRDGYFTDDSGSAGRKASQTPETKAQ
ncbi:hypothetical protein PHSY_003829 [Pseudozyma hubeiensis SY62]|uniref:Uncharacterized protein n=1 Tax=Pseudozyma hubeiensis (strain SY62) TaxID=1305764 RepID=R9P4L8_PSEHS|nr:hypothetical protein PHSY_003829 [Pseudozyma hubeiensis SY62]GAC96249.1 hypothetical protein PHSY_003829 [Pseudozyma hubeiensis SY62]